MHDATHEGLGVQPDNEIPVGLLSVLGVIFMVGMLGVFLALQSLFTVLLDENLMQKQLGVPNQALLELRVRETEQLENYKVLDATAGRYQIPVARAMELVVKDRAAAGMAEARPVTAEAVPADAAVPAEAVPAGAVPATEGAAPAAAPAEAGK